MALRVISGLNFKKVGDHKMRVTESTGSLDFDIILDDLGVQYDDAAGGARTVESAVTQWAHEDMSSILTVYDDFAGILKTALDNASNTHGNGWTYTVTWDSSAFTYAISAGGANAFTLAFAVHGDDGTRFRNLLGHDGDIGPGFTATSDVRPYYINDAAGGAKSNVSDDYEPPEVASGGFTLGGLFFTVSADEVAKWYDFDLMFEDHAATAKRKVTAAVPWSFEHLWEHNRGTEPLLVVDAVDSTVFYLRPEIVPWRPDRASPDWDGAWAIPFRCYVRGRL